MATKNEEKIFYIQRPLPEDVALDNMKMPVIKAINEEVSDLEHLSPINFQSLDKKKDNRKKLVLNFRNDDKLERLWTHSLDYIPLIASCGAVVTPDYSVSSSMNPYWMDQYIFRNRYLGCLWQSYGAKVIPSIAWDTPETFDICFSGVEPGGIVCVSTLGVGRNLDVFEAGYEEMKKRLHPSTVILYGDFKPNMSGKFYHVKYTDPFVLKIPYEQISLFPQSKIFAREVH